MGSAWSGVSTETKSQIVPPIEKVTADSTDPRYRRLIHLLRLNHHEHAIYYHGLKYHNHLAYILVSAYMFGASVDQLNDIYDKESKELEQWTDSPEEIDPDNWRAHFGAKEYQRAYLHFFEDETIRTNATVWSFLTDRCVPKDGPSYRDNQLLHGLVEGVGHPLIHLGYALEIEDKGLAMEALTMAATSYQNVHEFVDNPSPPQTFLRITDMREIFTRIYDDDTFDAICERYGCGHPDRVLEEAPPYMLFDSYEIQKETMSTTFQTQVEAATLMFIASHKENNPQYDFFLAHAVTAAHALRIVLPQLSFQQAWHVLRSHMVLSTMLYISQCRPNIKDDLVRNIDTTGKDWDYIRKQALEGEHRYDSHYVKVLRSFYEFEKLYGKGESDSDPKYDLYLKAAVKFADTFKGWTGFGTSNEPSLDTKMSNGSN
ncbi:Questin oxidase [Drechslerella dactyloides]|uniref:Questin oxidase n=1 Tax=Drechslerella dactyloides TaxID=74499 RepID=A0AAD6NGU5_DREDA|nr:Questin oxidase [Drechslerella dactyloides]